MAENIKNNSNSVEIVIDDGAVRVPIKNKQGEEIGVFTFHPTDVNIVKRYNEIVDKFDEITAPLENVSIAPDGTAADTNDAAAATALSEAEKRLFEAVDYLFDGNMSEAFFGKMNPFSPVNGYFYCESAINAVGKLINSKFDQETKRIENRVNRYTRRYMAKNKGKNNR